MRKNKSAISLVIAMGLALVSILLIVLLVEYMIPFGRNIRGSENSAGAYYNAYSGIERGLYFFSKRIGKEEKDDVIPSPTLSDNYPDNGYSFSTSSAGAKLPAEGTGTSDYDNNWNIIAMGDSVQLSVGYNYFTTLGSETIKVYFRVPDFRYTGLGKVAGDNNLPVINWQLSSDSFTLNSVQDDSSSLIRVSDINEVNKNTKFIRMAGRVGKIVGEDNTTTFQDFYNMHCKSDTAKCILRFSLINPISEENSKASIPYLEWQIDLIGVTIPLRYSRIESTGTMLGYTRKLNVRYPQDTIPEALDFTVFQ